MHTTQPPPQTFDWLKGDILAGALTLTANKPARMPPSLYDIARRHLTASIDLRQNSTPFFGAAAFCTTKIVNFRRGPSPSLLTLVLLAPDFLAYIATPPLLPKASTPIQERKWNFVPINKGRVKKKKD